MTATDDLDPLTKLAIKHGTDKWGPHFYTPIYHRLFAHLRERPLRLLEIGVGGYEHRNVGGASLAMWADYFPHAQITGVDIADKQLVLDSRVKVLRGSQDDANFLGKVCEERGPFDIIIDDGSHIPKHVVASFGILFPKLADGGIYVIEDVQTGFWPQYGGSILHGGDTFKLARTLMEYLNHGEIALVDRYRAIPDYARQVRALHAYHNILAIEKADNREPSSEAYDLGNPFAVHALGTIQQAFEQSPSAETGALLIELHSRGGDHAKAQELADAVLARWPDSATAWHAAFLVAVRSGDAAGKARCAERLRAINAGNPNASG